MGFETEWFPILELTEQNLAFALTNCREKNNVRIGVMFSRLVDMNEFASEILTRINYGDLDGFEVRLETPAGSFCPVIHVVYKETSSELLLFTRNELYSLDDSGKKFTCILYQNGMDRYFLENQKNLFAASEATAWRVQEDSSTSPDVDELDQFISGFHIKQDTNKEE